MTTDKHTAVDEMALEEAINTAFAGLPIGAHPRVLVRAAVEAYEAAKQQPDKAEVVERMAGAFYNVIPPESHTDSHNWHTYCHTLAEIALQYLPAEALPPQRDDSGLREIEQYLTSGLDDVEIANLTQHDKHILELARNGQKSPQHDDSLVESMQRWIDHPTKALTS